MPNGRPFNHKTSTCRERTNVKKPPAKQNQPSSDSQIKAVGSNSEKQLTAKVKSGGQQK
jgi:hypothetical protein